jgi:hypothetical protein
MPVFIAAYTYKKAYFQYKNEQFLLLSNVTTPSRLAESLPKRSQFLESILLRPYQIDILRRQPQHPRLNKPQTLS